MNLYIVTGHTSTDNSETFLLNLARGSNLSGLSGIPVKRLLNEDYFLVRPLMIFSRDNTKQNIKNQEEEVTGRTRRRRSALTT